MTKLSSLILTIPLLSISAIAADLNEKKEANFTDTDVNKTVIIDNTIALNEELMTQEEKEMFKKMFFRIDMQTKTYINSKKEDLLSSLEATFSEEKRNELESMLDNYINQTTTETLDYIDKITAEDIQVELKNQVNAERKDKERSERLNDLKSRVKGKNAVLELRRLKEKNKIPGLSYVIKNDDLQKFCMDMTKSIIKLENEKALETVRASCLSVVYDVLQTLYDTGE